MISSFWNLCRACPSVPVEKLPPIQTQASRTVAKSLTSPQSLHSEYRSTFQWHEYVGSRADSSVTHHQAVVRQPTQASQGHVFWSGGTKGVEVESERRGRRPDLTINKSTNGWCLKSTADQIRSQNSFQARSHSKLESSGEGSGVPRKSLSMGTIRAFEGTVPIHTHKASNAETGASLTALDSQVVMDTTNKGPDSLEWSEHKAYRENISASYEGDRSSELRKPDRRKEYKSEYKKQFRPFSQYEYVDGKFFKKRGDQEPASPWYKEVIELRKKAGEYRNRGWGTELVPQHLAEVYHQNLWDQVSRRSSLAALALITTTTQKSVSKEEKDKENARKSKAKRSLSRPNTATPKHPISDLDKSKADPQGRDSEAVQGAKKKLYDGTGSATNRIASASARGKARSQSAGPGGRSPRKATRQVIVPKEREPVDVHKPMLRHPRPTTLATSPRPKASSDKGQRDLNTKLVKTLQFDQSSADPSMGFSEPVIKSPPEPTRVKSPEQVILRSPDPVNWTVPLDTTKSFTVTQNIRDAPPSPRFRAGERLHGAEGRIGHHPISGQHSSAGSTKASSPLSTISTRSGLAQTHNLTGPSLAKSSIPQSAATKPSIKPREKENHPVVNTEKFGLSTGGDSGISPLKTSTENKTSGSGSSAPHSTVNGFNDRKKASHDVGKVDKAKQEGSRISDKPVTAAIGTHSIHDSKPTSQKKTAPVSSSASETTASKTVPGTTLRCLEDPTFMFDPPKSVSESSPKGSTGTASTTSSLPVAKKGPVGSHSKPNVPPRGAIRVLEAPTVPTIPVATGDKLSFVPPAPVATSKRPGLGASHVSEAPPPQTKLPSYRVLDAPDPAELYGASSSGGRNRATEVIDKARTRFDKFWGKSKDEEI